MNQAPEESGTDRAATGMLLGLAAVYFLIEFLPGVAGSYGYFIDEFYYLACTDHLAAGYVDHPPLSVLLLWVIRTVAGDSLAAVRLVPALAGAATIVRARVALVGSDRRGIPTAVANGQCGCAVGRRRLGKKGGSRCT